MAKRKAKEYNPQVLFDVEGSQSPVEMARAYYKQMASLPAGTTSYRQNIAYQGAMLDRYGAIEGSCINAKEAIRLAQIVYYNFGIVRHALDTMAEFTIKDIRFQSKKKASRQALEGWAEGIDLKSFLDQVALEYYRSGNVYIYRFESSIKNIPFNIDNSEVKISSSTKIPVRYMLIDPNLISYVGHGVLNNTQYQIAIPASEVQATIQHFKDNPQAFGELPTEFQTAMKAYMGGTQKGKAGEIIIRLNPDNIIVLHRKKQPYEQYALPFLAGVFDDLEFRQELRNMDKAIARVVARILIHVKVGNAEHIPSPEALQAMQSKLANPSTSTYLVTDGLVEIKQYFPDIAGMLDPKKYDAVNSDITTALGISPAAYGEAGGNFSSNFLGIKVLVERIVDGRDKILRQFLIPEAQRVAKAFKLKAHVTPEIWGVDLTNEIELKKIYTRLYEDGVISAQTAIESIRDNTFPTFDEELQRQEEFKKQTEDGLFQPVVNRGGNSQDAGRPSGTENPEQTQVRKTTPKGAEAVYVRSFTDEDLAHAKADAATFIKGKFGVKRLSKEQSKVVESACVEFLSENQYSPILLTNFLEKMFK